ncbi:hypothetical protein MRX96_040878 [Rhipicephalus microplus]
MLPALLPPHLEDKLLEEGNGKKALLRARERKGKKKMPPKGAVCLSLSFSGHHVIGTEYLFLPFSCPSCLIFGLGKKRLGALGCFDGSAGLALLFSAVSPPLLAFRPSPPRRAIRARRSVTLGFRMHNCVNESVHTLQFADLTGKLTETEVWASIR